MVGTGLVIVLAAIYIVINAACIGFFWRRRRPPARVQRAPAPGHPGAGDRGVRAGLAGGRGHPGVLVRDATGRAGVLHGAGVAGWMVVGIGYLIYLYRRHPAAGHRGRPGAPGRRRDRGLKLFSAGARARRSASLSASGNRNPPEPSRSRRARLGNTDPSRRDVERPARLTAKDLGRMRRRPEDRLGDTNDRNAVLGPDYERPGKAWPAGLRASDGSRRPRSALAPPYAGTTAATRWRAQFAGGQEHVRADHGVARDTPSRPVSGRDRGPPGQACPAVCSRSDRRSRHRFVQIVPIHRTARLNGPASSDVALAGRRAWSAVMVGAATRPPRPRWLLGSSPRLSRPVVAPFVD